MGRIGIRNLKKNESSIPKTQKGRSAAKKGETSWWKRGNRTTQKKRREYNGIAPVIVQ